jgi:hypothetical protein
MPVTPPIVNKYIKPKTHHTEVFLRKEFDLPPNRVISHLKIFIPVGTPMTIVAAVKYARVSMSKPTVYM